MDRRPDLGEGVLRPHRAAPDLSVVEEEQLKKERMNELVHSCLFSERRRKATHFMIKFKTTPVNKVFMSFFHVLCILTLKQRLKTFQTLKFYPIY